MHSTHVSEHFSHTPPTSPEPERFAKRPQLQASAIFPRMALCDPARISVGPVGQLASHLFSSR